MLKMLENFKRNFVLFLHFQKHIHKQSVLHSKTKHATNETD